MYQTIQVSTCVSVQGETVEVLANGEVVVRDGQKLYRGWPIGKQRPFRRRASAVPDAVRNVATGTSRAA